MRHALPAGAYPAIALAAFYWFAGTVTPGTGDMLEYDRRAPILSQLRTGQLAASRELVSEQPAPS